MTDDLGSGRPSMERVMEPFGEVDCESEVRSLGGGYSQLYFEETPFHADAVERSAYLIVGRRGAGKTALSQSFAFQRVFGDPVYIDVDEPRVFSQVLSQLAEEAIRASYEATARLKELWEFVIWSLIFERLRGESSDIAAACADVPASTKASHTVAHLIHTLREFFLGPDREQHAQELLISKLMSAEQIKVAKERVLDIARVRPIVIAFDTLERYQISNDGLMRSTGALVSCAADLNRSLAPRGIHVKVFLAGEVYPHLRESGLDNLLKSLKDPVHMLWRPRDLLRLICWRLLFTLNEHKIDVGISADRVRWDNHRDVYNAVWVKIFGERMENELGHSESTLAYVLRHTQKRPRQLIFLCNRIAKEAMRDNTFPQCQPNHIRAGVAAAEVELADEVLNSFSTIYPGINRIIDAMMRIPIRFPGKELDRRAAQSAPEWPAGEYTPARFRAMLAELGVVGVARRGGEESGYIGGDFEYQMTTRLPLTQHDDCVIHPMFFRRLNVTVNTSARVMPFSNEHEIHEAQGERR